MPEGGELFNIAKQLDHKVGSKYILNVKSYTTSYSHLTNILCPERIVSVSYNKKRIIFEMSSCWMISFLHVTGRWVITNNKPSNKICHFYFEIVSGSVYDDLFIQDDNDELYLYFTETSPGPENLLFFKLRDVDRYFSKMGPDFIMERPSFNEFLSIIEKKVPDDMEICEFLLAQWIISSFGNWMKCEIMYLAKLHPGRLMKSLTNEELCRLYSCMIVICDKSVETQGFSFSTYYLPDGNKGTYKPLVYMLETDLYDNKINVNIFKDKRKTYWCPKIQI